MILNRFSNFWHRHLSRHLETYNLIEISRQAILHNYDFIQSLHPSSHIWPVLKSNAYGHGIAQIAEILKDRKFEYLVVDSYYEALKVWEVSAQPVLLIGPVPVQNLKLFDFRKVTLVVYNLETVRELGQLNKPVKIHLKLNTGLNRQGIKPGQIEEFLSLISQYPKLQLEGVCSHLASADDETEDSYTERQEDIFVSAVQKIRDLGFSPKFIHLTNTPGTTKIFHEACNTVRLGLGLYGYNPIAARDSYSKKLNQLKPALKFTSEVTNIICLEPGDRVSYAGTFTATKKIKIGLLPVGYYEVLPRSLSNLGYVRCQKQDLPLVGNICMNLCLFSLENKDIKVGDKVEIINPDPAAKNSVYELARLSGTLPYEFLVNIAEPIRRVVV